MIPTAPSSGSGTSEALAPHGLRIRRLTLPSRASRYSASFAAAMRTRTRSDAGSTVLAFARSGALRLVRTTEKRVLSRYVIR